MYQHSITAYPLPSVLQLFCHMGSYFPLLQKMPCRKKEILWICETLWANPETLSSPFLRFTKINAILIFKLFKKTTCLTSGARDTSTTTPCTACCLRLGEGTLGQLFSLYQLPLEDSPAGDWLQFREHVGLWGLADFHSLRENG